MLSSGWHKLWRKLWTLLSGNKETITSLDQFKPAIVRNLKKESENYNHNGIIFLKPQKAVRARKKIFRNHLQVQIYVYPIVKLQHCCLKSKRREISFLVFVGIMTDNNHLDILARWTSRDLMNLRIYLLNIPCTLNMILIGWIHKIVYLVYVMSCHDFKDKIRINLSMDCSQMDLLYLYKHFKDFQHEIEWSQNIQITLNICVKKDICDEIENANRMLLEENKIIKGQLLENDKFIEELKKKLEFLKSDKLVSERKAMAEHEDMRQQLLKKDELIDKKTRQFEMLETKCLLLEGKLSKLQDEYQELLLEFGRLSVENDSKVNKVKTTDQFQKIFIPKSLTSSVLNIKGNSSCDSGPMRNVLSENKVSLLPPSSSLCPSRKQSVDSGEQLAAVSAIQVNSQKKCENNGLDLNTRSESEIVTEQLRLSIEVVERNNEGRIGLLNQPSSSVPADVYNAYKFLLVTISDTLLYEDIIKLQEWANEKFSVQTNLNTYEIFMELDKKGAISALDVSQLSVFFESIVRHDLLYLIDEFKNGDYDRLRKLVYQNKRSRRVSSSNQVHSPRFRLPNSNTPGSPQRSAGNAQVKVSNTQFNVSNTQVNISNGRVLERPSAAEDNNPTSHVGRDHQCSGRFGSNFSSTSSSRIRSGLLMHGNSENIPDVSAVTNTRDNPENEHRINATDTPVMTELVRQKQTLQSRQPPSRCNHSHNATGQCNGAHSHTDAHVHRAASNGNNQDNWLCDHYKRRCLVKFDCCDKYWACHRCHNNESTCGHRKLKSRDTTMIKCVECGKEQKFGQFCVSCNTQFADFFCGICKHLTGTDDHPYHCDKCGICRIHGDRSYHCDVCGICLDVQLRGNHKCRPDSAHDECCICLEDAFTGCQILPCSHKVHKDCATQMIRMGITRCPICRESFAHKLERRPVKKKTTRRK